MGLRTSALLIAGYLGHQCHKIGSTYDDKCFSLGSWVGVFEFVSYPPCYALCVAVWYYYFEAIVGLVPPFLFPGVHTNSGFRGAPVIDFSRRNFFYFLALQ